MKNSIIIGKRKAAEEKKRQEALAAVQEDLEKSVVFYPVCVHTMDLTKTYSPTEQSTLDSPLMAAQIPGGVLLDVGSGTTHYLFLPGYRLEQVEINDKAWHYKFAVKLVDTAKQ